jgi:hypothetical protein
VLPGNSSLRRRLAWIGALAAVAAIGGLSVRELARHVESAASAHAQDPATADAAAALAREPRFLEFELPAEFATTAGGKVVTGFRLGFFARGSATPVQTIEIPRDAVQISGRTGRIRLPPFPAGLTNPEIRLQTVFGGETGGWSESTSIAPLGERPASRCVACGRAPACAASPRPPSAPRQRRSVTAADIARHPLLADALRAVLPRDADVDASVQGFPNVRMLAVAVVVCRDNKIPFGTLQERVRQDPRVPLRRTVAMLRPDLDMKRVWANVQPEVRKLLGAGRKPGK